MPEPTVDTRGETAAPAKAAVALEAARKVALSVVTLLTEIAVVVYIGMSVGGYLSAKTIVADCQRVNLAKVGEAYVQCTIVEPKKDAPTAPPR